MRTAVVVGAGVGGLAAAGALARTGWHVTLLEKEDRLRGGGTALLIWPNGLAAIEALGLSLGDVSFPVNDGGVRRPDGRWLIEAGASSATPLVAGAAPGTQAEPVAQQPVIVHADDLHDALMVGLGGQVEVRTAMEITMVRAGLAERPAVGTGKHVFEADLVVAADGARSVIRRRLMSQAALVSTGFTAWRAVIPWYRAPKLPENVLPAGQLLGAGHRFLYTGLGERGNAGTSSRGGIYWVATAPGAPRPESASTQLNLLRRWFADWHAPVGELLEATEAEDLVQQPGEELKPLPPRFDVPVGAGGFLLVGDAGHVSSPSLTQGACLAFEDAVTMQATLRDAVPGHTLPRILEEYSYVRMPRVSRVSRASRRLDLLVQAQGKLTVRARDAALGRFPAGLLDRASAVARDWTVPR